MKLTKKKYLYTIAAIVISLTANGQNKNQLYLPNEYRNAYKSETRSWDGKPGKNYFQNTADYFIRAEFYPELKLLKGEEIIQYKNNSFQRLNELFFHLHQNLFKKGVERDFDVNPGSLHDGVVIKDIKINDKTIKIKDLQYESTLMFVPIENPIEAGSLTKIEIEWELYIPSTPEARTGTYYDNNFFIAYWYPKTCVYDDIIGWNKINGFTGYTEFYNDYGNFDVEITVPSEYIVWSSGLLQNEKEIFTTDYLKKIQKAKNTDDIVSIISKRDRKGNNITVNGDKHTWKFHLDNTTDFAFAVSSDYYWDATSVKIGEKRIFINIVYNNENQNFKEVADFASKSIRFFSNEMPGIEFPYTQFTIFNGQASGMEFPGMANNEKGNSRYNTIELTAHEIAHSYWPFYVGCNEQEYPWMDEGLVTFFTDLAINEILNDSTYLPFQSFINSFNKNTGTFSYESELMNTSLKYSHTFRYIYYEKAPTVFYLLYDYLGKEKFLKAIKEFSNNWKGKHPIPNDLFITFNNIANEDLSWFWKPWFYELGYPDIGISDIIQKNDSTEIVVRNTGICPTPIKLIIILDDGTIKTISKPMSVWKTSDTYYSFKIPENNVLEIVIDKNLVPDNFSNNNVWTPPHHIDQSKLVEYVGKYEERNIIIENGELIYFREGSSSGKMKMIAINNDYFRFNEIDWFRIRIIRKDDEIISIEGHYSDNRSNPVDISKRSN